MQNSPWKKIEDRQKERALKRDAVLRVAAALFTEKGFHATSLEDVASRLHVTKPTLYYYVKNKEDILYECVRTGLEMIEEAADSVDRAGGSAQEKLSAVMRKYVEIVTMDFGRCLIRVGDEPLHPASRRKLRALKASIDRKFRSIIAQGEAEGILGPWDPKIAAFVVGGALSWIGQWYRPDGPQQPEEIAEQCISILINGLAKR